MAKDKKLSEIVSTIYYLLLSDICFCDIAAHHAVGVEVIGVLANCILHHPDPCIPVRVIHRDDDSLKFIVKIVCVSRIYIVN